jgi:hypothetical protein
MSISIVRRESLSARRRTIVRHGRYVGAHNSGLSNPSLLGTPEGTTIITTSGAIVENRIFYGTLTISAADVTVRNCLIRLQGYAVGSMYGLDASSVPVSEIRAFSCLIEDCEIDAGSNGSPAALYIGGNTYARRINAYGGNDVAKCNGPNNRIEASYFHDAVLQPGGHADGLQTTGTQNTLWLGNHINMDAAHNAAIQIGSEQGNNHYLRIENNYLNGGGYTVNALWKNGGPGEVGTYLNCTLTGNRFGPDRAFGTPLRGDRTTDSTYLIESNNVYDATGIAV